MPRRTAASVPENFTVTGIARALTVPQHRLIHLCEQGVVVPDHQEAHGRGSRRRFSQRNVFEFAVALQMRRLEIPVSFIRAVIQVLKVFEAQVGKLLRGFALPDSLRADGAPYVSLLVVDGDRLFFRIRAGERETVLGGVTVPRPSIRGRARAHRAVGDLRRTTADAITRARTRTEVDLTQIARDIDGPQS